MFSVLGGGAAVCGAEEAVDVGHVREPCVIGDGRDAVAGGGQTFGGAGSPLKGARTTAVCKFLGLISYPLYITHYPMIYVQMEWAARHADAPLSIHIWVAVSIFIASLAIAYTSVKVYDLPVRA